MGLLVNPSGVAMVADGAIDLCHLPPYLLPLTFLCVIAAPVHWQATACPSWGIPPLVPIAAVAEGDKSIPLDTAQAQSRDQAVVVARSRYEAHWGHLDHHHIVIDILTDPPEGTVCLDVGNPTGPPEGTIHLDVAAVEVLQEHLSPLNQNLTGSDLRVGLSSSATRHHYLGFRRMENAMTCVHCCGQQFAATYPCIT